MSANIAKSDVTAVVLCGGKGSRLGGQDKPLMDIGGRRIIDHILVAMTAQAAHVVISCSRNVALYESLRHTVAVDEDDQEGPLAGLHVALRSVQTPWALTVPGDSPFLPQTLVDRLSGDALRQGVAVPYADNERQNLTLLINAEHRADLGRFYEGGGRAMRQWLDATGIESTDLSDLPDAFFNVNTQQELSQAKARAAD